MHYYVGKFPEGSIRNQQDLQYILSSMEGEDVVFYRVGQSGYIEEMRVPGGYVIERDNVNFKLVGTKKNSFAPGGELKNQSMYLGDSGVALGDGQSPSHESHRLFVDKDLAEVYSNWMKTDNEYKASVAAWHRYCDKLFRDFDSGNYD